MSATITIEAKVAGQKRPLVPGWEMALPPETEGRGERLRLRDFITRVVLQEVAAYRERQEERRLIHALTAAQIQRGVEQGKIDSGGREETAADVEPQDAVDTALLAFQDGLYYVFIDGEQHADLETEVYLQPGSRVTFLRLVALAGG